MKNNTHAKKKLLAYLPRGWLAGVVSLIATITFILSPRNAAKLNRSILEMNPKLKGILNGTFPFPEEYPVHVVGHCMNPGYDPESTLWKMHPKRNSALACGGETFTIHTQHKKPSFPLKAGACGLWPATYTKKGTPPAGWISEPVCGRLLMSACLHACEAAGFPVTSIRPGPEGQCTEKYPSLNGTTFVDYTFAQSDPNDPNEKCAKYLKQQICRPLQYKVLEKSSFFILAPLAVYLVAWIHDNIRQGTANDSGHNRAINDDEPLLDLENSQQDEALLIA